MYMGLIIKGPCIQGFSHQFPYDSIVPEVRKIENVAVGAGSKPRDLGVKKRGPERLFRGFVGDEFNYPVIWGIFNNKPL